MKSRQDRALVFIIETYGCQSWKTRTRERKKVKAFENWCWRTMFRIPQMTKRTNMGVNWKEVHMGK